ncbi:MAG: hypothetical protein Q7S32_03440 [bacterium]|nr:hypothetical protein [bacterium]
MAETITKKTKEEILKTPLNELGVTLANSPLEAAVKKLYEELSQSGIQFRPATYLSTDWGCPDGVPVIAMPFYLADETLWKIEKEKMGLGDKINTTADQGEIQQILRHEAGHAFNYAYKLHTLPGWQDMFGVYEKAYEDNFAPIAGSDRFVKHLEGWYAQKHPDEDFAETFAVAITPGFDWKKIYKGTEAYMKLVYVTELIKEYRDKPVPAFASTLDEPIETVKMTVEEWYTKALSTTKARKKVLILFYQEYPKGRPSRDEVVDQIKKVLLELNYSVVLLPINRSIEKITNGITQEKPDLVFNLCETFRDNDKFDFNVTALLEMLHTPFTGSGSSSLFLSGNKEISKKIFSYHNIPYAKFFVVPIGTDPEVPKNMSFPLFVKPNHEDASIGIDDQSVVFNEEELKAKVGEMHNSIKDDAMVEEYIEGREFFVSILGHNLLRALPVIELNFSNWPEDKHKIYTFNAKIETTSEEFKNTTIIAPEDLPPEVAAKMQDVAMKVFRAMGATDYARVDLRLSKDNKIYVLEANLNPYLAKKSETAFSAQLSGLNYEQLISKIVELALARAGVH